MRLASSQWMKVEQEVTKVSRRDGHNENTHVRQVNRSEKNCTHLVGSTPSDGAKKLDRQIKTLILIVTHPQGHGQGKVPYCARNFKYNVP
jgi:hypothetical protein